MNYIGRKAGKHMEGETDVAYANSQMFIAEAEDLYAGLQKYFATTGQLVTPQDGLRRGMRVSNVVS